MSSNAVLVNILCEGRLDQVFVERCLKRLGYGAHELRTVASPVGRGSAERFVLDRYADEVRNFRSRSSRARSGLIIVIDADTHSVEYRLNQLAEKLKDAKLPPRDDSEQIAILAPRRNIATWINSLMGQSADEETDYDRNHPLRGHEGQCRPAADTLSRHLKSGAAPLNEWPPSLKQACSELRRLKWS